MSERTGQKTDLKSVQDALTAINQVFRANQLGVEIDSETLNMGLRSLASLPEAELERISEEQRGIGGKDLRKRMYG